MQQVWGKLLTFSGIAVIAGCIAWSAFNLWLPIWLGILVGAILGVPLLIVGMRMQSQTLQPAANAEPETFLPTAQSFRAFVVNASLSLFAMALAALPVVLFAPGLWMLQGDGWSTAWLRSGIAVSMLFVLQHWVPACYRWMLTRFESILIDERKAAFRNTATSSVTSIRSFLMDHRLEFAWLLLVAVLVSGWIAIPNLPVGGRGRGRGLALALQWLAAHPRTVATSAVWVMLKIACDAIWVLVQRRGIQTRKPGPDEGSQ